MNKPLRVLIVEDSEDDAELLVSELERSGYNLISKRVDTAVAMNAALDQECLDIVIADYTMPNFSAPAALTLLKEKELDLPFIIVSGSIGEDIAVTAMKAGAHDYVMKEKLARLAPAVERELREASERRKRREAELALRQNEERFRSLIENALDIITVIDADGVISYNSPSVKKVLGYKPEDLVGSNFVQYLHLEDREVVLQTLTKTVQNSDIALEVEFRFQHQDGSWRILEAVGKTFVDSATSHKISIVINSRDITDRKRAEEIRRSLEREKELSEARFSFVSMMSHEFRNPLGTILASGELLKNYSHKTTPEQKERCLDRIEDAAQEMMQLLDDILNLSRAEVGKLEFNPQPLNLLEFCQIFMEGIKLCSSDKYTFNLVTRGECSKADMDEKLLGHILTNLVSNAIKYSPEGGMVQFELSCENNEAIFQIQDWGIGIALNEQTQLFESFYRGQNVSKIPGTGLGLCIVKKFVDLHNGKIALKSEVGVGTTFRVTLPLNRQISTGQQEVRPCRVI